jgi:hypothetical protein
MLYKFRNRDGAISKPGTDADKNYRKFETETTDTEIKSKRRNKSVHELVAQLI